MLILFWIVLRREVTLAFTRIGVALRAVAMNFLVALLFPLALSGNPELLGAMAPAILWIGAILAMMQVIPNLYHEDWADGTLEQYRLLPWPLELLAAVKILAHWLIYALPLILCAPLIALFMQWPGALWPMLGALAVGLLGFVALGSMIAALTLELKRSGSIMTLLLLPLALPIIIFGAHADHENALMLLSGLVLLFLSLSIWLSAAALRET